MNFAEVGAQSYQLQLQHQKRQELLRSAVPQAENGFLSPSATASSYLSATPAKYIKEIKSGEFFMLSKLLLKSLNKLNYELEHCHNDYVEVVVENNQLKTRKRRPEVITNIEDWTSCFSIYTAVLVQKYLFKATELVQYLNLIRYGAHHSPGLGWCIYDHKFRMRLSLNKSPSWGIIDKQLWLCRFTVSSTKLQK